MSSLTATEKTVSDISVLVGRASASEGIRDSVGRINMPPLADIDFDGNSDMLRRSRGDANDFVPESRGVTGFLCWPVGE